ncbi:hypothetical protein H6F43_04285 [Leptolyngbya sp. FACHB-36]|uniref:hypothetical protein n=1 Tax=Leptolyngbya sp. FACHB-36 TaxID=2692808 RepID=UPI0016814AA7|nr:hypothetical protein [Leptolyngbya sp. FACHB-36]MBD2019402.1 hypothetical protein [Leptolyngbya sp. FACHB-36]
MSLLEYCRDSESLNRARIQEKPVRRKIEDLQIASIVLIVLGVFLLAASMVTLNPAATVFVAISSAAGIYGLYLADLYKDFW